MPESPDSPAAVSLVSTYAPLSPDGPLPPAVTEAMVSSAYRALRPDLRAKQVLATLGIRPGLEQASRVLRRALDRADAREGDQDAPESSARPPLYLALYVWLKDHLASADYVYREIVKPAEHERDELTFLDPATFRDRIRADAARFEGIAEIAGGSEPEALALFALAYGLLQPDEAAAIVEPVAALGEPFRRFFGVE
ncbi:MAG: hypothetical protein ACM3NQ_12045 [Bacteroidales bacterium]